MKLNHVAILDDSPFFRYRPAMKFGDELTGQIRGVDDKGRGIFEYSLPQIVDGIRTVAVPFTSPGDQINSTFVRRDQGKWIAKLKEVTHPSADRVNTPCPHAGTCGGCLWQHMDYAAQLRMKQEMIDRAFEQAGHEERAKEIIPCSELFYFRNRMDYVVGWKGEVGLKEYGSWSRYIDLSTCLLLDETTPKILEEVRQLMRELKLEPWDAKRHTGLIRYVVIRLGKNTKERMITLVVQDLSRVTQHASRIKERLGPLCTTLYIGENPDTTDLSLCKTFDLLQGNAFLTEEVNEIKYSIHPNSFFQTNTMMAGQLQKTVLEFLGKPSSVLDLYCGLGFFGIACAKHGMKVSGYEIDAQAIELAQKNAKLNKVEDRTEFFAGAIESTPLMTQAFDAVILDPPRAGLHPRVIEMLLEQKPKELIYVSCNYHSFVKELSQLKSIYKIEQLAALDLFPHTPHVEIVTKLIKK